MRRCRTCGEDFPATTEFFHRNSNRADGLNVNCIQCKQTAQKEYRQEYFKDEERRLRAALRDTRTAHGCTYEKYMELLKKQKGRCAICRRKPKGAKFNERRLHVDHCHESGVIRGLLCVNCNIGLGNFYDSEPLLKKALAYLRSNRA